MRERKRKKEEQEVEEEEERLRKEREARERQDEMTLGSSTIKIKTKTEINFFLFPGETRDQIAIYSSKLEELQNEKKLLFLQLKKVLNEDDRKRQQLHKESKYFFQKLFFKSKFNFSFL